MSACFVVKATFEGMQPILRQVPPRVLSFSTHTVWDYVIVTSLHLQATPTCNPSCAALMAATYPPGPLPTTTRSASLCPPLSHLWREMAPYDSRG